MGCSGGGGGCFVGWYYPLRNVPDVIGLVGRCESAVESHVLQGRDARSVRVLVPDCRGLDQNFHDVIIVDMGGIAGVACLPAGFIRLNAQVATGGE